MRRLSLALLLAVPLVVALLPPIAVRAQGLSFAGAWTLNRSLSELPKEMGFSVNWMPVPSSGGQGAAPSGGARGRRGGGSRGGALPTGAFAGSRESYDEAQRRQLLTGEARNPPPRLIISETPGALSITDDQGRVRSLSTTAIQQLIDVQGVALTVRTTHAPDRYVVVYDVEQDRKLRYTYSRVVSPPQVIVDLEFLEHGTPGDKAHLVYEQGATDPAPPSTPALAATTTVGAARTVTGRPAESFDQRPGGELKGLKSLGVVVEDLSKPAIACGLNQSALETAMSKRLTAGGLSVRRNADDDTYLYINIKTDQLPNGSCLSRYDASLYTHTTAKLSYGDRSVLVRVELMHRGGIGNSAAGQHAQAITHELENDVDLFVTQIHAAN